MVNYEEKSKIGFLFNNFSLKPTSENLKVMEIFMELKLFHRFKIQRCNVILSAAECALQLVAAKAKVLSKEENGKAHRHHRNQTKSIRLKRKYTKSAAVTEEEQGKPYQTRSGRKVQKRKCTNYCCRMNKKSHIFFSSHIY